MVPLTAAASSAIRDVHSPLTPQMQPRIVQQLRQPGSGTLQLPQVQQALSRPQMPVPGQVPMQGRKNQSMPSPIQPATVPQGGPMSVANGVNPSQRIQVPFSKSQNAPTPGAVGKNQPAPAPTISGRETVGSPYRGV